MKIDFENAKIYVRPGSTDLRKGATGLAPVFDSGTSFFHSESVFSLRNPYLRESSKIKAKPFASNQKEQMKRIPFKEYCPDLDFERLVGVSEFFGNLISKNPYIELERAEILRRTLDSRIKETERLFENQQEN